MRTVRISLAIIVLAIANAFVWSAVVHKLDNRQPSTVVYKQSDRDELTALLKALARPGVQWDI